MAQQILLRKAGTKGALGAVPLFVTPTINNDNEIFSHFPKLKQKKIKKFLSFLREDPNFNLNLHTTEITITDGSGLAIDIVDFLTWLTFTRKQRPELKQPPEIGQFLVKFSPKSLKKFVVKDKRGGVPIVVERKRDVISDWLIL